MIADTLTEIFGEPVYSYGAERAIEDGVLCEPFPDKFPGWLLTAGVHAELERTDPDRAYIYKAIPLLMDAQMIVRSHEDHLYTHGLEGNVTNQTLWIAANERGGFTLLFPEEY